MSSKFVNAIKAINQKVLSSVRVNRSLRTCLNVLRDYGILTGPRGLSFTWWDVVVYVGDIANRACPLLFILFFSLFVFMAHSTVFNSINFHDSSPPSHSVLQVSFLPY